MKNSRGFSFFEVLISLAILTIVISGVLSFKTNKVNSSILTKSQFDYQNLAEEFLFLLSLDQNCTASFANPDIVGPPPYANSLSFEAQNIQGSESIAQVMEVPIYTGTMENMRSRLRFEAGSQFGNIIIDSVRLYLPDHNTGNLADSPSDSIQAEILLNGRMKVNSNDFRVISPIRKLVLLNVTTVGGVSTINGCGAINQ